MRCFCSTENLYMITLDYLISDHNGAGRDALRKICDYADVTGQIVFLSVTSDIPEYGIVGSEERNIELVEFYKNYGFEMTDRPYEWEGKFYTNNIMERKPNGHPATVRIRH